MRMKATGREPILYEAARWSREKEFLYWLCRFSSFGAVPVRRIGETLGRYEDAYYIEGIELKKFGIVKREEVCRKYDLWKGQFQRMQEEYYGLTERGIRFITPLDQEYPDKLRNIYDYPMGLFVKGELPDDSRPSVAIIGARNCTGYGKRAAETMGRELAENGVQIISGLALGIDGAGHEGALKGQGKTFGVLGCGVNICYPRSNYKLYEQILTQGGVLSEYGPDQEPYASNFPVRNRIISGLSDVILVIEARRKSGSLITAELGLEQGREIFALPGRITDPLSEGCNQLIQNGAGILISPENVLEYMGIFYKNRMNLHEKDQKGLAKTEKMVYSCLDSEPRHLEQVAAATGMSVSSCMSALLELELGGFAVRTTGQYYIRG
ncbi:MAG: DNA-processing protein DprA [Clostridium sp.]|nr:DNA-processing protein DprA [Clostridium sp.]